MINNYDINEYTKEDEKIVSSFIPKDSLSNVIFDNESKMIPEIRKKLIDISNEYIDFIGIEFFIHDIVITGSLANYNWSNYSDIDLHWSLYPEYDGSFDDYESIVLDETSYFEEVMDLLTQEEFHFSAEVCFALYVLFVQRK